MNHDRALALLALGAVVAVTWLGLPFATGILLGALLAFTLDPFYRRLAKRFKSDTLASLAVVISTAAIVVGAVVGFATLFVTRAVQLANTARQALQPGGQLSGWVDAVLGWLSRFGISSEEVNARLAAAAGEIASISAKLAGSFATGTLSTLLSLFFALLTMHLVLKNWQRIVQEVVAVSPLHHDCSRYLLTEFERVGRMTVSGTVVTGLAQGALAAIGFWITGVPQPIFFGVTTAIASLVPAVGTLLVWVPAGIYLIATDHATKGVLELCWGALVVVGFCDYVIRPRLVGDKAMPTLLVFVALFGGIEMLGLPGLIVGPLIMALAITVLRFYAKGKKNRSSTSS